MARKIQPDEAEPQIECIEEVDNLVFEPMQFEPDPQPPLPLHDGTTVNWPDDGQAAAISRILAGRSLLHYCDNQERSEIVFVTYPDGQKYRLHY